MKDYASLKKQNSGTLAIVAVLLVCIVLSATMLFGRLLSYAPAEKMQEIPLTQSNGRTHVTVGQRPQAARPVGRPLLLAITPRVLTANPGFSAYDENTVWSGETDVEIFSVRYDNETGETTVKSQDGVKVLAPGTGSTYEFALKNTGNVSLDYTLEMDAWFSDTEYPIPVVVSVKGYENNYLLGSETEMVDVLRLEEVREAGTIAAGNIQPYALTWEWPFEVDDVYDTMLGNLAVEEDITLTIVIRTTAQYSEDPNTPGGTPPQTGDTAQIALYAVLMVVSFAGILALLLLRRKEEGNEVS